MPRSYSFDHFTVPDSDADRDLARREKQEVAAQSDAPQGETDIHYGKKFAETEAILKARAEERAAACRAGPHGPSRASPPRWPPRRCRVGRAWR